ncbi:unnamed protein product [Ixodes pacificus]
MLVISLIMGLWRRVSDHSLKSGEGVQLLFFYWYMLVNNIFVLYFVLCRTPERNVIYVLFPIDWATVFTSYYERFVYISDTFIYILFTCHAGRC